MVKVTPQLARDVWERAGELGGWKKHGVKSQICREFGLSRPTLYELLKKYPKLPIKKYAEYEEFYEIPQVTQFLKVAGKEKAKHLRRCWLALDRRNPMKWTSEDLAILRKHPRVIDSVTGSISYHIMVGAVRKFLSLNRPTLFQKEKTNLLSTKGLKRPKGSRRKWFLIPDEFDKFIEVIDDIEFGTQVVCQVKWGCRHSALVHKTFTVSKIDILPKARGNIVGIAHLYEQKTDKTWQKWIDKATMILLRKYIQIKKKDG